MTIKEFEFSRSALYTVVFAIFGSIIGAGSALLRPLMNRGGVHYEAIIELFVVMPVLCLIITLLNVRLKYRLALSVIAVQLTLLWLSNYMGRFVVGLFLDPMLDDFVGILIVFWLGSILGAASIMGVIRLICPLRYDPTSCQNCGYSLKGLGVSGVCPECGHPFSTESLDVSEKDLQPQA